MCRNYIDISIETNIKITHDRTDILNDTVRNGVILKEIGKTNIDNLSRLKMKN